MVEVGGCKAVVFDFGGVLITSITNQIGVIAARHDVSVPTMVEILLGPHESGDHPWHRAERGELAVADIQAQLGPWAARHGVTLHGDELDAVMAPGHYTVITEMLDKAAALKDAGVITGLLTNTFAEFQPTMQRDIPFRHFTHVVESFAVGARKPERAIYDITQERVGVAPHELLYLDDFVQNVAMAREVGWQVIHVTDPLAALAQIDAYL